MPTNHRYLFVPRSSNSKTGPMPVTYTSRDSCPSTCPLAGDKGCYAEGGPVSLAWRRAATHGITLDALASQIQALPPGTVWRHNVAGDLPSVPGQDTVSPHALGLLVQANTGRRGFTFTHKTDGESLTWTRHATAWGFTINLSANTLEEADRLAATGQPTVVLLPAGTEGTVRVRTPGGRRVVTCPAQTRDNVTCQSCQLCARPTRQTIVGFLAHGTRAKAATAVARRIPITPVPATA
jgi:hypothetical protein